MMGPILVVVGILITGILAIVLINRGGDNEQPGHVEPYMPPVTVVAVHPNYNALYEEAVANPRINFTKLREGDGVLRPKYETLAEYDARRAAADAYDDFYSQPHQIEVRK